jgi:DNA-binding transcriptional regulator/RsmH inhibitor MraZ
MMIGTFTHKIDASGRVSLPSSFRASWPGDIILFLNSSLGVIESCTEKKFQEIAHKINAGSTEYMGKDFTGRDILMNSVRLNISAEGRIRLPDNFVNEIRALDVVTFIGLYDRFQIHGKKSAQVIESLSKKKKE